MSRPLKEHLQLRKQALFDLAGTGLISQTGGEAIDSNFELPNVTEAVTTLPSIETFMISPDGTIAAMGSNDALNAAWLPSVERLARQVRDWAKGNDVEISGSSFVTASVTSASDVNGEAHLDDDQFVPTDGAGLVAIVGDIAGPRVACAPIPHEEITPPHPLVVDEQLVAGFANGTGVDRDAVSHPNDASNIASTAYGPNELVVFPQFGQLHAGPGPCGTSDEVRHLLVYRAATLPGSDPPGVRPQD